MWGDESFLPDPEAAGLLAHFKQAELQEDRGRRALAHHDRLDLSPGVAAAVSRRA